MVSLRNTRILRTVSGTAAAATALGAAQLAAIPFGSAADALNALGSAVIDLTPGPPDRGISGGGRPTITLP
jgi:hypothetical protein